MIEYSVPVSVVLVRFIGFGFFPPLGIVVRSTYREMSRRVEGRKKTRAIWCTNLDKCIEEVSNGISRR